MYAEGIEQVEGYLADGDPSPEAHAPIVLASDFNGRFLELCHDWIEEVRAEAEQWDTTVALVRPSGPVAGWSRSCDEHGRFVGARARTPCASRPSLVRDGDRGRRAQDRTVPPGDDGEASYGTPGFRVKDKLFLRIRSEAEGGLVVFVSDLGEKEALLQSDPKKFFTTPHYDGYATVLVNLTAIGVQELRELITESWRLKAPKRVLQAFDDQPRKKR